MLEREVLAQLSRRGVASDRRKVNPFHDVVPPLDLLRWLRCRRRLRDQTDGVGACASLESVVSRVLSLDAVLDTLQPAYKCLGLVERCAERNKRALDECQKSFPHCTVAAALDRVDLVEDDVLEPLAPLDVLWRQEKRLEHFGNCDEHLA